MNPEQEITKAWWNARYYYTNRKQTQTRDRFMWFLLALGTEMRGRQLMTAYKEAFLSPEMEKAMGLEDRLEEEFQTVCATYVQTIEVNTAVLGIPMRKTLTTEETMTRIAKVVAGKLIRGVYGSCAELKYADVIVRCLWNGAEEAYPGMEEYLETVMEAGDPGLRAFVLGARGRS